VTVLICNGDFGVVLRRREGEEIISVNIEIQDYFPIFSGVNQFFSFFHTTGDNSRHQIYLGLKTASKIKACSYQINYFLPSPTSQKKAWLRWLAKNET
jgi:hypothetical protein